MEFNDLEAVAQVLRTGRIAAVLTEPALTNIGIVAARGGLPCRAARTLRRDRDPAHDRRDPHLLGRARRATQAWGLQPDIVTIGKAIAGGIPIGAFGLSGQLAAALLDRSATADADIVDVGGVGGTLAGNPLSMAAARATLALVLTDDAFVGMTDLAGRLADRAEQAIADVACPGPSPASGPARSIGSAPRRPPMGPSPPRPRTLS